MKIHYLQSELTGVVLAGGKSSRFGTDKGLFPYQGKPLVQHAIDILKPFCGEVLVSTNKPDAYVFTGLDIITDIYTDCGPLGGMHSGFLQAKGKVLFFLGCDMPGVRGIVFPYLLDHLDENQAAVPLNNGFRETLCMAMKKECLKTVEQAIKQKKYRILDMLEGLKVAYPELNQQPFYEKDMFQNINYRGDLKE